MFGCVPTLGTLVVLRWSLISLSFGDVQAAVPKVSVGAPAFTDLDEQAGELKGTVTWSPTTSGNVKEYKIYLAKDAQGTDRWLFGKAPFGTNYINVPENTKREAFSYFMIFTANEDGEQDMLVTSVNPLRIYDHTLNFPLVSPGDVTYEDIDPKEGYVSATLQWTPPKDETTVTHYKAYLTAGWQTTTRVEITGSEVPVGTNYIGVFFNTQMLWSHIVVYALNPNGLNVNKPASPLVDFSEKAPSHAPRSVTFLDTDSDGGLLGGVITWDPPEYFPSSTAYTVYIGVARPAPPPFNLQTDSRIPFGEVRVGTNSMALPQGTVLAANDHFLVYSKNVAGESDSAAGVKLADSVQVSNVQFIDTDLLPRVVGGQVNWTLPNLMPTVTAFAVFVVSGSTACAPGLCLMPPSRLPDAEVPHTASHATVQSAPLPGRMGRVEVWARSGAVWAYAPTVLALEDQALPKPPAGITFRDEDLNAGKIAGTIFVQQDPADAGIVVAYRLHWGAGSQNSSEVEKLDKMPFAVLQVHDSHTETALAYVLPESTLLPEGATHIVAFSVSKAGKQEQGLVAALVDRIAPTVEPKGLVFADKDPLAGELMGEVLVLAAPDESSISRYLVHWGTEAGHFGDPLAALPAVGSDVSWFLRSHLPSNATHLVVLSANGDGAMTHGPSVLLVDFVKSSRPDILVEFVDMDMRRGLYGGTVKVSQLGDSRNVAYNLYLSRGCCTRLELLGKIRPVRGSSSLFAYEIADGSRLDKNGATHISVVETDANEQESPLGTDLELVDRFLPDVPREVSFVDQDRRVGRFGGSVIIDPGSTGTVGDQVCYSIFFGKSSDERLGMAIVKLCSAGPQAVKYNMRIGTVPPSSATHLIVVAANDYGEASQVAIELRDNNEQVTMPSKKDSIIVVPVLAEKWNVSAPSVQEEQEEDDSNVAFWACVFGFFVVTLILAAILARILCKAKPEPDPPPEPGVWEPPKPSPVIPEEPEPIMPIQQEPEPEIEADFCVPEESGRIADIAASEERGAQLGQPSAAFLAQIDARRASVPGYEVSSMQHHTIIHDSVHRPGRVVPNAYVTPAGNAVSPSKGFLCGVQCQPEQDYEAHPSLTATVRGPAWPPQDPTHIYQRVEPEDVYEEEVLGTSLPGPVLAQEGWTPVRRQTAPPPPSSSNGYLSWELQTPQPQLTPPQAAAASSANVNGHRVEL